jgi:hypothetical protein
MRIDEPKVGDTCCVTHCGQSYPGIPLFHCKAVGGYTIYLTLCDQCYKFIQDHLEVTVLLLLVDEEEAIVGQIMNK